MLSHLLMPRLRRVTFFAAVACLALGYGLAQGQTSDTMDRSDSTSVGSGESSSSQPVLVNFEGSGAASLPAAPAPGSGAARSGGGQYDAGSSQRVGLLEHLTFEAGGGFNGPLGNSSNYITWGGQFGVGGGYQFNDRLSVMLDYQFIGDKLPGALIAETGATGGDAHIWSVTVNPIIDLFPKRSNDFYVSGGGGFYRKVTNFTDPEEVDYCDYFYCEPGYENQVVGHFSSNQGGFNIGGGYQHRVGGAASDSRMKLFAEVRYVDVFTPASAIAPNGLGTATVGSGTRLIPVTFGVRW